MRYITLTPSFPFSTVGSCAGLLIRMSLVRAQQREPALVAQLVERGFCKADVASSNLVGGLTNHNICLIFLLCEGSALGEQSPTLAELIQW